MTPLFVVDSRRHLSGAMVKVVRKISSMARSPNVLPTEDVVQGKEWKEGLKFSPDKAIEEAETLPSAWYTSPNVAKSEMDDIFCKNWLLVGHKEQVHSPGGYFTGRIGSAKFVICRDEIGQLRAFHNVCSHHAAAIACGAGSVEHFACPYHGWTYALDGRLKKATRLGGIKNFSPKNYGLVSIQAAEWGQFILLNLSNNDTSADNSAVKDQEIVARDWLGDPMVEALREAKVDDPDLRHVARREYEINCNWKVYCDNYLDGGYHVPYAHLGLCEELDMSSYENEVVGKGSVQRCRSDKDASRVGGSANYFFLYPNCMVNRYGFWMDTNVVVPLGPQKCLVTSNWFLHKDAPSEDPLYVDSSIDASHKIQLEDIGLCERVQEGLLSPAYNVGRYAPKVENLMHHFHCLVYKDIEASLVISKTM